MLKVFACETKYTLACTFSTIGEYIHICEAESSLKTSRTLSE